MKITLLVLFMAAPALAEHHLKNGISVYEGLVTQRLPDRVYDMSDEEWYDYATRHNRMARYANQNAAVKSSGHTRYATITESGGWRQTRFGGGYGAGGYGGNGGYDGYLDSGQGGGGGSWRYGAGRPGNSKLSSYGSGSKSYTMEYHEWPAFNGGDIELLNPYVRPQRPREDVHAR